MENRKNETLGKILKAGLLPNLIKDKLDPAKMVEIFLETGVHAVEISCRRNDTLTVMEMLKTKFPEMRFGVSSLVEDGPYFDFLQRRGPKFPSIKEAVDAGADFLVSALEFNAETYQEYNHLPIIPAVATSNEAKVQLDLGANIIKFCGPHFFGGPTYFKSIISAAPVHSAIPILLTGGMRPELIDEYVEAGMLVSVSGSDLILKGQYEDLQENFNAKAVKAAVKAYLDAYRQAREKHLPGVDFDSADAVKIQEQSGKFLNV